MKREDKAQPDLLTEINGDDFLSSIGIHLILWSTLIDTVDPNESYEPFARMREEMRLQAEVLAVMISKFPRILKRMKWQPPEDVGVERVENPLRALKDEPLPSSDEGVDLGFGVSIDDTPPLPH